MSASTIEQIQKGAWQLTKKTFRSYVVANLRANHTLAMPVLYRLA